MNEILTKLFIIAAAIQLGLLLRDFDNMSNHEIQLKLKSAQAKILKIDWKPISVFPEEARRFQSK